MKQIIQNYRTGKLERAELPVPVCSSKTLEILSKELSFSKSIIIEEALRIFLEKKLKR